MGYYIRFISNDERDLSLDILESALKQADDAYSIERDEDADNYGLLKHNNDLYGEVDVSYLDDPLSDEEIEELLEDAEEAQGEKKADVLSVLNNANAIVAVRVLWQGRETEAMLEKIDPLWQWLLANRTGLLQVDGEGYYDRAGLILEVEYHKRRYA
ncbi:MAG: hypothetical protein L0229_10085 [Blastocatellia bacterium]|nr:hypothetical protein [Blastocatellia bacterium]